MSTSDGPPTESTQLECGGCEQGLLFGFQLDREHSAGKLFHADGTEVCAVPEPESLAPSALWPQSASVPYVPGRVGAVTPGLRTYVDPPEERDRPPVMGVVLLLCLLIGLVVACGTLVWAWFPWEVLP